MATAGDSTTVRALRIETLSTVRWAVTCTVLEGIFLGPPAALRQIIDDAREQLIRNPTDEAYVNMALTSEERMVERFRTLRGEDLREQIGEDLAVFRVMRLTGRLFHNPRFISCPASFFR